MLGTKNGSNKNFQEVVFMQTTFSQPQTAVPEPKALKSIRLAAVIFSAASIISIFGNCIYYIILGILYSSSISLANTMIRCISPLLGLIPALCLLVIGTKKNISKTTFVIAKIAIAVYYVIMIIALIVILIQNTKNGDFNLKLLESCKSLNSVIFDILYAVFYIAFFGFFENLSSLRVSEDTADEQAPVMTSSANEYEPFASSAQTNAFNQAAAEPTADGFSGQNTAPGDLFVDPLIYREMIVHILLCLFTCGIWSCIWIYKTTA